METEVPRHKPVAKCASVLYRQQLIDYKHLEIMRNDKYTKAVLTVIAICLLVLTAKQLNLISEAYAYAEGSEDLSSLREIEYGIVPMNEDGSINVKLIHSNELDVNIVGVNTTDELEVEVVEFDSNDVVDVNIKEIGNSSVSTGGPIPVEIE